MSGPGIVHVVTRVLIAEPSPDVRSLLRRAVKQVGFDPVELTAREREDPSGADVLLLEPAMRGGVELARSARQSRPALAIVMCSIYSCTPELAALEPVAYLVKPFRREELERALRVAGASASRIEAA
jgi:DNA-binding response OmpR family regulator